MTESLFTVRMPQLVAAFTPLLTMVPILSINESRTAGAGRWYILSAVIFILICACVALGFAATKKYAFSVSKDAITAHKTTLQASDIRSIRLRGRMLDVLPQRKKRRISVTFEKTDVERAHAVLSQFALEHGLPFDRK